MAGIQQEWRNYMPKGWIGQPSPKSRHTGNGWFGEMNKVYVDEKKILLCNDTDHNCSRMG